MENLRLTVKRHLPDVKLAHCYKHGGCKPNSVSIWINHHICFVFVGSSGKFEFCAVIRHKTKKKKRTYYISYYSLLNCLTILTDIFALLEHVFISQFVFLVMIIISEQSKNGIHTVFNPISHISTDAIPTTKTILFSECVRSQIFTGCYFCLGSSVPSLKTTFAGVLFRPNSTKSIVRPLSFQFSSVVEQMASYIILVFQDNIFWIRTYLVSPLAYKWNLHIYYKLTKHL